MLATSSLATYKIYHRYFSVKFRQQPFSEGSIFEQRCHGVHFERTKLRAVSVVTKDSPLVCDNCVFAFPFLSCGGQD